MTLSNQKLFFLLLLVCGITSALYYPGLNGNFYFDDYPNIVNNYRLHLSSLHPLAIWEAAWSGITGNLGRPITILSFSLNTYFTGLHPGPMKITNLVIHLLCGIGIIFLSKLLIKNWFTGFDAKKINVISLLIGAIWMTHPLHLTSVLYIVQRMTSLASLFTLLAMLSYCLFREKMLVGKSNWLYFFPVAVFGSLSILSKEIGALIPLFLLSIEVFVYKFRCSSSSDTMKLYALYFCIVAMPVIIGFGYLHYQPETILSYGLREYSLTERLLTEARIVTNYFKTIISPDITQLGLIKDNIVISTSLITPITTLFSILFIAILLITIAISYKKYPYVSFGLSWFIIGHLLESTIITLELRFEHRNYLPSFGVLLAAVILLYSYFSDKNKVNYFFIFFILWLTAISTVTFIRANYWKNEYTLALYDVERHPNSVRSNLIMGSVYQSVYNNISDSKDKNELYKEGVKYFQTAYELEPESITALLAKSIFTCIHTKNFTNKDIQLIKAKLQNAKLGPEPQNALTLFSKAVINKHCKISMKDYLDIMYLALASKQINRVGKAQILVNLSGYFGTIQRDIKSAIKLLTSAISEDPSKLAYRIELSKLLIIIGDHKGALDELNHVINEDKFGTYKNTINKLKSDINQSKIELSNS